MGRTRAALLAAAGSCVAAHGARRTTMLDIAAAAGVAKGTLYNHFRAREDVYRALVEVEVTALLDRADRAGIERGAAAALDQLAVGLRDHPVLCRLRVEEPGTLVGLLVGAAEDGGDGSGADGAAASPSWQTARDRVGRWARPDATDAALRWLLSWALLPGPITGSGLFARPDSGDGVAGTDGPPVRPTAVG